MVSWAGVSSHNSYLTRSPQKATSPQEASSE